MCMFEKSEPLGTIGGNVAVTVWRLLKN
jgi:hypothetical protein